MTSGATTGANPSRWYRNIDEMPLAAFVDVLCDGDLSSLYKGSPPENRDHTLERRHFEQLHTEYTRRMLGDDVSVYENLKRMAIALSSIRILEAAVMLAKDGGITDPECVRILRSNGVRLTGDRERDVLVLSSLHGKAVRRYGEAKEKYEAQLAQGGRQDREHFMTVMASMSSHFKFAIPFLTTTVGEFCGLYRRMRDEIRETRARQAHQQNNPGRRK